MAHDANQNFLHSNYDSGLDHESPITDHFSLSIPASVIGQK